MARAEFDFSEFEVWADLVQRAPSVTERQAKAVVSRGALQIKNQARKNAPRGPHTPYYADSIAYDIEVKGGEISAEIGPTPGRRQWGLGNILEYGSSHNSPVPHLEPALDAEAPRFVKAAEDLAAEPFE